MSRLIGIVVLAGCLYIGYQSYENAKPDQAMQDSSKGIACEVDESCVVQASDPRVVKGDVFRRQYEWRTTVGPVTVECSRTYIWFGPWTCVPHEGSIPGL